MTTLKLRIFRAWFMIRFVSWFWTVPNNTSATTTAYVANHLTVMKLSNDYIQLFLRTSMFHFACFSYHCVCVCMCQLLVWPLLDTPQPYHHVHKVATAMKLVLEYGVLGHFNGSSWSCRKASGIHPIIDLSDRHLITSIIMCYSGELDAWTPIQVQYCFTHTHTHTHTHTPTHRHTHTHTHHHN